MFGGGGGGFVKESGKVGGVIGGANGGAVGGRNGVCKTGTAKAELRATMKNAVVGGAMLML